MKTVVARVPVRLDIFDSKALFLIGDLVAANRVLLRHFKDPDEQIPSPCSGMFFWVEGKKDPAPVAWLPVWPNTPRQYAALAHEAWHVVHFLLQLHGIELTDDTDELYGYTLDHLIRSVLERRPERP